MSRDGHRSHSRSRSYLRYRRMRGQRRHHLGLRLLRSVFIKERSDYSRFSFVRILVGDKHHSKQSKLVLSMKFILYNCWICQKRISIYSAAEAPLGFVISLEVIMISSEDWQMEFRYLELPGKNFRCYTFILCASKDYVTVLYKLACQKQLDICWWFVLMMLFTDYSAVFATQLSDVGLQRQNVSLQTLSHYNCAVQNR